MPLTDKQTKGLVSDLDAINFDIKNNGDCVSA